MSRHAKSISIRHLQAAVKTALEATKKEHPDSRLAPAISPEPLELIYRPWILCGYPIPWPWEEFGQPETVNFVRTFTKSLSTNPQVAALGVEGKFEPAVYFSGQQASVGFVPADANITE